MSPIYFKFHHAMADGMAGAGVSARDRCPHQHGKLQGVRYGSQRLTKRPRSQHPRAFSVVLARRQPVCWRRSKRFPNCPLRSQMPVWMRSMRENTTPPAPFTAPKTPMNRSITAQRRLAVQKLSLSRIKAIGKATHITVNEVVLALCSQCAQTLSRGERPVAGPVTVGLGAGLAA